MNTCKKLTLIAILLITGSTLVHGAEVAPDAEKATTELVSYCGMFHDFPADAEDFIMESLQKCLEQGANPNKGLHALVNNEEYIEKPNRTERMLSLLLEYKANINALHGTGYDRAPALVAAAVSHEKNGMLKILLKFNADVNKRDARGDSALDIAILGGKIEMVRYLLGQGAHDLNPRTLKLFERNLISGTIKSSSPAERQKIKEQIFQLFKEREEMFEVEEQIRELFESQKKLLRKLGKRAIQRSWQLIPTPGNPELPLQ